LDTTQQVSGEEVSDVKSSNFVNSLSGKVAGLDIKSSISVGLLKWLLEVTVQFLVIKLYLLLMVYQ
jgi:hypothetical protein